MARMSRRSKRYTRQAQIGEAGVALIARRVAEMGFIWHPRRIDHGIDGEIELVSPAGDVLNQVLFVQSKASDANFPGEDSERFHYVCDEADLEYWLSGSAPVILVCSHPARDEAWWVSIKDAHRRVSRRVDFNKHRDRLDPSVAGALLQLGTSSAPSVYLRPPPIREELLSNLLKVERLPATLYVAPAIHRRPAEAVECLRSAQVFDSDWILTGNSVFSFRRLDEEPFSRLAAGPAEALETAELANSKSPDVQRDFVRLLNQTLTDVTHVELRRHRRGYLFFKPTPNLSVRRAGSKGRRRGRIVFQAYPHPRDPERVRWCRHLAVAARFMRLEDEWYLSLRPTYHYTFDGYREVPWGSELTKEMKRLERNSAVRGLVKFWAHYLRGEQSLFTKPDWRLGFGELLRFDVDRGIDDGAWNATEDVPLGSQHQNAARLFEENQ